MRDVGRIDHDRAFALQHLNRRLGQPVGGIAEAEELVPGNADPRAPQPVLVERSGVVGGDVSRGARRLGVAGIHARHRAQQGGRIRHAPAERAGGVLRVGDRDDPRAAHQPDGRLDADDAVGRRRTHDRPVGLRPHRDGAEVGGDGRTRARARATRIPVQDERIAALPAPGAPPAGRAGRADVGPLAHVGLGQQDRARGPEPLGDVRVPRRDRTLQRERPAVVVIRSAVSMLSLSSTGMPCSGPRAPLAARSRSSASAMDRASGLVSMMDWSMGPGAVNRRDPRQIQLGNAPRRQAALGHAGLQLRDGRFLELERRRSRQRGRGGGKRRRRRSGPHPARRRRAKHGGMPQERTAVDKLAVVGHRSLRLGGMIGLLKIAAGAPDRRPRGPAGDGLPSRLRLSPRPAAPTATPRPTRSACRRTTGKRRTARPGGTRRPGHGSAPRPARW